MTNATTTFHTSGHVEVAVVIVTFNSADEIDDLISSLRAEADSTSLRVIVADNSSSDSTLAELALHEDVVVVSTGGNLGYAGGLNAAIEHAGGHDAILVLNPDLRVEPGSIGTLLRTMRATPTAGVIAPRILDDHGRTAMSLFNEPTAVRGWADAFLGPIWKSRPAALSEWIRSPDEYEKARSVGWVTGAAMLIPRAVAEQVGEWDERFFLYSEETDYCRRVRDAGFEVRYEPAATVHHSQGKSGSSAQLDALLAVNRVRYMRKHSPHTANMYRGGARVGELLRARRSQSARLSATYLGDESLWSDLPSGSWHGDEQARHPVASVVIPAHNEANVIGRTLQAIAKPAQLGTLEVIVVCNGCSDDTAAVAAGFPGVRVLNREEPSKTQALNAGDDLVGAWPRIYLDADIELPSAALPALLRSLKTTAIKAGRPPFVYDTAGATWLVRAYFRARMRVPALSQSLWGAGVYSVTEEGHQRVGRFPNVVADDVYVDRLFAASEKAIPLAPPVKVKTPRTNADLLGVLARNRRGPSEQGVDSGAATAMTLIRTVRGPVGLFDASIYALLTVRARRKARTTPMTWERDQSSRVE